MAFDHLVGCHVQDNTIPNRHYQFGLQLVQDELRYIHAIKEESKIQLNFIKNY